MRGLGKLSVGGGWLWGGGGGSWPQTPPPSHHHPPRLSRPLSAPARERETFHQPFCEHVLQHSCCSTFLWQRLFFLTSTQKLPSAQDSSFAFHRPRRRRTGRRRRKGKRRRKWGKKKSWKRRSTHTHGCQEVSGDSRSFVLSIQSQLKFINPENHWSPVQWLVPCRWGGGWGQGGWGGREQIWGRDTETHRERDRSTDRQREKHHTISKMSCIENAELIFCDKEPKVDHQSSELSIQVVDIKGHGAGQRTQSLDVQENASFIMITTFICTLQ